MFSIKLSPHIFLIDLKPRGLKRFIASYVIRAKKIAIIETGPKATIPNLLAGLKEIDVDLTHIDYIMISHIHLDHGGGAGSLLRHLPNAKLVVHKRGIFHISNPQKLWVQSRQVLNTIARLYQEPTPVAPKRIITAEDGMTFDLGDGIELRVIETLGHSSHHQSFYEKRSQSIFPGDTAGVYLQEFNVTIPTTPPPFHFEKTLASIKKLKQLNPKLLYYSHFGQAANAVEKLQSYIDQLKLWANVISKKRIKESTLEEIREEIEKSDPALRNISKYVKTHLFMNKGTIPQSIEGFNKYFEFIEKKANA
ncbi:MAG: MBL fold metallo-hydrolase [Candidatus Bathyarchaeota archaeon]|nr:MAG: MBL fold metallo-hydrolase [Candidatus Bathyarchaeota archaeon]